jgi:hypothetical protein
MPRYGAIHRIVDFVARTVPRRGSGEYSKLFVHRVIDYLKFFDSIQERNQYVTLTAHASDGVWLSFKGRRVPESAHA